MAKRVVRYLLPCAAIRPTAAHKSVHIGPRIDTPVPHADAATHFPDLKLSYTETLLC